MPPVDNNNLSSNGIEKLIDQHFGPLYPDYADHTRPVLIRQARDLLVCTFHGDLERFEAGFLRPAAAIVSGLRSVYLQGQVSEISWRRPFRGIGHGQMIALFIVNGEIIRFSVGIKAYPGCGYVIYVIVAYPRK